jgi:hypothetical protein
MDSLYLLFIIIESYSKYKFKDLTDNVLKQFQQITNDLKLAAKIELKTKVSKQSKQDLKEILSKVKDDLITQQRYIFKLMKESNLELPIDYSDPGKAIRKME